jgi:hypothetical protein
MTMVDDLTVEIPSAGSSGGGPLIEEGRRVLTLAGIKTDEKPGWQDPLRFDWTFKVSNPKTPDLYQTYFTDEGEERTIEWRRGTSRRMGKGGGKVSTARMWAEALAGREFSDSDRINLRELVGRRMLAMVIHKPPDEQGRIWAEISTEVPPKPFGGADTRAPTSNGAAAVKQAEAAARAKAIARPPAEGTANDGLLAQWERLIKRAEGIEMPGVESYKAIDPELLSDAELGAKVGELRQAVAAAL